MKKLVWILLKVKAKKKEKSTRRHSYLKSCQQN